MNKPLLAPVHLLIGVVLIGLAVASVITLLAVDRGWLGLRMTYSESGAVVNRAVGPAAAIPLGSVLTAISASDDRVEFVAHDFVIEPAGGLATIDEYAEFRARQSRLAAIQDSPAVTLTAADGQTWTVAPAAHRPLSDLPPDFWVQVFVAVAAWLISGTIWAFRGGETSTRYLLLSGASTLTFSSFASVYSTRELALPGSLFGFLNDFNFLGGSMFAASLLALMLYYPRKIAPRWVGLAIVGIFVGWWVAQQVGLFESMAFARRFLVLVAVGSTFILAAVHWRGTRHDPIARAALQWFLLSWLVGVTIFAGLILFPQMFGIDTSAFQGYGFLLFLLVYGGLAFGILRYRLFDLGEWWVRALVWMISIAVLVVFDLLFLLGLGLSTSLSLGLALLVCGVVWLPLRGWIWERMFPRAATSDRAMFEDVISVALTADGEAQAAAWRSLLERVFKPMRIELAPTGATPGFLEHGLSLVIAAVGDSPALQLSYADGGRRLFNRRDLELADDLSSMFGHAIESRTAYQTGAAAERRRIALDIHDNVGARLMTALHSRGDDRKDSLIRDTMTSLRSIIRDASHRDAPLNEALADLRRETADRLESQSIELDWPLAEENAFSFPVGAQVLHSLRSIMREAISNVIKHAHARKVAIAIADRDGVLRLVLEDDGEGFNPDAVMRGSGLDNIRRRAEQLGGSVEWSKGALGRGARLSVALPLGTGPKPAAGSSTS
jgi:two-component system sensor histidine kinase DevS